MASTDDMPLAEAMAKPEAPPQLDEADSRLVGSMAAKVNAAEQQLGYERLEYLQREGALLAEVTKLRGDLNALVELLRPKYVEGDGWVLDSRTGQWVQRVRPESV